MNNLCILVMNLQDKLNFEKFIKFANQKFPGANIIVASKRDHNQVGVKEYVFETDDADEVINTIVKNNEDRQFVLVRDFDNDNFEPIYSVYAGLKKDNQICLLSKKKNKFVEFFAKIFNAVVHFLFGYYLIGGSLAYVAFGPIPFDILKQTENPSLYTKIDKWTGIKDSPATSAPKIKFKPKVLKNVIRLACLSLAFVVPLILWILIKYIQNSIGLKLLCVFIMALCLSLIIIDILIIVTKTKIGENTYECAEIKNMAKSPED